MAIAMSLAFHELATNAAKYGALSAPGGRVDISWRLLSEVGGRRLQLVWRESGGRAISPPTRTGFGTRLIQRTFATEGGEVRMEYRATGLVCVMDVRLPDDLVEAWKVELQLA
jgi:two-component sensor histidine kinase